MLILDLGAGPGGAAQGYRTVGFDVLGVNAVFRPHYPGRFVLMDVLTYVREDLLPALAAGPPVPFTAIHLHAGDDSDHLESLLTFSGLPTVVERILAASPAQERRYRFELSFPLFVGAKAAAWEWPAIDPVGLEAMTNAERAHATPPVFTEFIGRQLLRSLAVPS